MEEKKEAGKHENHEHPEHHEHHEHHELKIDNDPDKVISKLGTKMKKNPWIAVSFVLGVVVIIFLIVMLTGIGGLGGVSKDVAAKNIIDFANAQGAGATLINVNDKGAFYEVNISMQGRYVPVYVTKDGKNMISTGGLVPLVATDDTNTNTNTPPADVPKSDKPVVELYVMSFCPYGNKGEDTMLPVYNLLKDKVDWKMHYIVSVSGTSVSSLHGQPEVDQNEREACVLTEYNLDKWWKFVTYVNTNCGSNGNCWEAAAKNASLDVNKIKSCVSTKGLNLMKSEQEASNAAGASGSPTMIINGVQTNAVYQYGNSDAYKTAICAAFNTPPKECSQALSGSTATSSGGSC